MLSVPFGGSRAIQAAGHKAVAKTLRRLEAFGFGSSDDDPTGRGRGNRLSAGRSKPTPTYKVMSQGCSLGGNAVGDKRTH